MMLKCISITVSLVFLAVLVIKIMDETMDNFEEKQDPYTLSLVDEIRHIHPDVHKVVDKLKFYAGKKSYTINKKDVYLCKTDENGTLYRKNQLVLVLIHEISHALCDEVGHTDKFNKIFDNLLQKAEEKGVYDPNIPHVQNYCPGPE